MPHEPNLTVPLSTAFRWSPDGSVRAPTGTSPCLAGGSDHTATALAALLQARRVVLWKDVLGIYPVNPRWGVQSSPIPYLGYGEAIEFANADATILHPATVEPVYEMGIPIEIRHLTGYKDNGMKTVIGPTLRQCRASKASHASLVSPA